MQLNGRFEIESNLGESQGPGLQGHCSSHRITDPAHRDTGGNVTGGLWRFALSISSSPQRCQGIRLYSQNLKQSIWTGISLPARGHNCITADWEEVKSPFSPSLWHSQNKITGQQIWRSNHKAQSNFSELLGENWWVCEMHVDYCSFFLPGAWRRILLF